MIITLPEKNMLNILHYKAIKYRYSTTGLDLQK